MKGKITVEEMPKTMTQAAELWAHWKWMKADCYGRSKGTEDRTVVIPSTKRYWHPSRGSRHGWHHPDTYICYSRMRGYSTCWILELTTALQPRLRLMLLEACWDWDARVEPLFQIAAWLPTILTRESHHVSWEYTSGMCLCWLVTWPAYRGKRAS